MVDWMQYYRRGQRLAGGPKGGYWGPKRGWVPEQRGLRGMNNELEGPKKGDMRGPKTGLLSLPHRAPWLARVNVPIEITCIQALYIIVQEGNISADFHEPFVVSNAAIPGVLGLVTFRCRLRPMQASSDIKRVSPQIYISIAVTLLRLTDMKTIRLLTTHPHTHCFMGPTLSCSLAPSPCLVKTLMTFSRYKVLILSNAISRIERSTLYMVLSAPTSSTLLARFPLTILFWAFACFVVTSQREITITELFSLGVANPEWTAVYSYSRDDVYRISTMTARCQTTTECVTFENR